MILQALISAIKPTPVLLKDMRNFDCSSQQADTWIEEYDRTSEAMGMDKLSSLSRYLDESTNN